MRYNTTQKMSFSGAIILVVIFLTWLLFGLYSCSYEMAWDPLID